MTNLHYTFPFLSFSATIAKCLFSLRIQGRLFHNDDDSVLPCSKNYSPSLGIPPLLSSYDLLHAALRLHG
jgi:hypothetical protein